MTAQGHNPEVHAGQQQEVSFDFGWGHGNQWAASRSHSVLQIDTQHFEATLWQWVVQVADHAVDRKVEQLVRAFDDSLESLVTTSHQQHDALVRNMDRKCLFVDTSHRQLPANWADAG